MWTTQRLLNRSSKDSRDLEIRLKSLQKSLAKLSHEGTFYYLFADNVTLVGIEAARLHGTPKGKNVGSSGDHEMRFLMNLGKVGISADLQVVQQGHEGEEPDEYKVSGTSTQDLILAVTLKYNAKDKSVKPVTTYTEQEAQYKTHSGCHQEGNFCEKLHQFFDEFGWIPVFIPTHALVNKAITEIDHL